MSLPHAERAVFFAVAVGLFVCGLVTDGGTAAGRQSSSTISLLAIDMIPLGNTETSLGPIDGCTSVEPGEALDIDYVVDAIPQDRPVAGFEVEIRYDPAVVEVVNVNSKLLLASAGSFLPLAGLNDTLPDSDGKLHISVLDGASYTDPEANSESGAGVLARLTLRARAPGVSKIEIGLEMQPLLYPIVLDTQDEMILADRLSGGSLAVGRDCPTAATQPEITELGPLNEKIIAGDLQTHGSLPTAASGESGGAGGAGGRPTGQSPGRSPTATASAQGSNSAEGNGGSSTWLIVLVVALVALAIAAVGGAWYLRRRPHLPSSHE